MIIPLVLARVDTRPAQAHNRGGGGLPRTGVESSADSKQKVDEL